MISISKNVANTEKFIKRFFVNDDGLLYDPFTVEFQIFDLSGAVPVQVYPATPGDRATAKKAKTGWWWAEYTPDGNGNEGLFQIRWIHRDVPAADEVELRQYFHVLPASAGVLADTMVTLKDVRDAGILDTEVGDSAVVALIESWQAFIERRTRQFFAPRYMTMKLDGNGSNTLFLPVPVIGVESLKINRRTEASDPSTYVVYGGIGGSYPDHRKNPKLVLRGTRDDVFDDDGMRSGGIRREVFLNGRQNQKLVGVFGYVEADWDAPPLLKRVLLKLVAKKKAAPGSEEDMVATMAGRVVSETTDRHSITYANIVSGNNRGGSIGITGDPEIEEALALYRAPISIRAAC